MSALAATAGIAIENAHLFEESRRRQLWLQASAQVASVLLSPASRNPLQLIAETVQRLADADTAAITLTTTDPGVLHIAVATGDDAAQLQGVNLPVQGSIAAAAMDTGRGVRVASIDNQRHFVHLALAMSAGAAMAVPMSGNADRKAPSCSSAEEDDPASLPTTSRWLRCSPTTPASPKSCSSLAPSSKKSLLLEDRDWIARDLHDHVVQGLFAARLTIQSVAAGIDSGPAQQLGRSVHGINDTIRQIRTSIFQLASPDHAEQTLRAAVLAVLRDVAPLLGFEPSVRFVGPVDTLAGGAVINEIEAVVREAVTNAAKHARPSKVTVQITAESDTLWVDISDNGIGVSLHPARRSSGLRNLRRRAENLEGTLSITRRNPTGTQLRWVIPIA